MSTGLTRSASSQQSRPSPAGRYISPGFGGNRTAVHHQQQHHSAASSHHQQQTSGGTNANVVAGGASPGISNLMMNATHLQQHPTPEFVPMEDFLALKRTLERERGQREESITRLREELYEMKESRRREKMDASFGMSLNPSSATTTTNSNPTNTTTTQQQQQLPRNTAASSSSVTSTTAATTTGAGGGGLLLDNSILGRLHRVEVYQNQTLPQQLESIEQSLRSHFDEKSRSTNEAHRTEVKRLNERCDTLTSAITSVKQDAGKYSLVETQIAQLASTANTASSGVQILQAQRVQDEENRSRLEKDLDSCVHSIKDLETNMTNKLDLAIAKFGNLDESFISTHVDKKLMQERKEIQDLVETKNNQVYQQIRDNHSAIESELKALQKVASVLDVQGERTSRVEERMTRMEDTLHPKIEEGLQQLESRVEVQIHNTNSTNKSLMKDLTTRLEARIDDKIGCSRDEIEQDFSTQFEEFNERVEDYNQQQMSEIQRLQAFVRSLASVVESGGSAATLILDGMESFVRDMRPDQAAVYSSVLERIASCRSNAVESAEGVTTADALRILYQFERGQASCLSTIRDEIGDLRAHIGLVGSATAVAAQFSSPLSK